MKTTKLTLIAALLLFIASCTQPSRIEQAFDEYAKVNLGNPDDYEITEVIKSDSLSSSLLHKYLYTMQEHYVIYNQEDEISSLDNLMCNLDTLSNYFIEHKVKVRQEHKVKLYYIYLFNDFSKPKVSTYKLDVKEVLPQEYAKYFK